ncbi:hypothetical protein ACWCSD_37330 [Nonomuraea sp. NPDC001684]
MLGFALMGRRSEITDIDVDDLTFTTDGLEVYVPFSKTDQNAHGEIVAIPYGQHPRTCPVRVTRAWLADLTDAGVTTGAAVPPDRPARPHRRARPSRRRSRPP